jgi:hypothetical protein
MKIEELISGKGDNEKIETLGISIPVSALKDLMTEGYLQLKPDPKSKTVTLCGKTCCACFTEQHLQERA